MTTKRFRKYVPDIRNGYTVAVTIIDNETNKQSASIDDFVDLLNELNKEKESWKRIACSNSNFVYILLHELDIAQEQGYEVSDPFKKLMEEKS